MGTPPSPVRAGRAGTLLALAGGLLAAGLLSAGCEIEKPEMPTFTTTLTVPLGEERLEVADLIQDEDYLVVGPDSSLAFAVNGAADTLDLDFDLAVDVPAAAAGAAIGVFGIDVSDSAAYSFTLAELYPPATALDGQQLPVPGFEFSLTAEAADLADLESAEIAAGTLHVALGNGLPVPVAGPVPPERIRVQLLDPADGTVITEVLFRDPIPAGGRATAAADLAGAVLPGEVAVRLSGGSPGSVAPVAIHADAALSVSVLLEDLDVAAAEAPVAAGSFGEEIRVALPDSIRLQSAAVAVGELVLDIASTLPFPCAARLCWPEILDAGGQPAALDLDLAAGQTLTARLDLAGRTISAPDDRLLSELTLSATVTTAGSEGRVVRLTADDGLQADLRPSTLRLGEVTGAIPERRFAFAPIREEVSLPEELGGLSLTAARLALTVANGTGLPARLEATLGGVSEQGVRVALDVAADVLPTEKPDEPTVIVLDQTNSDIVAFLNNLPRVITLEGAVAVGGDGVVGTVRPGDRAAVSWCIEAPLEVIVENTVIRGDPDDLGFDDDTRDLIDEHVRGARVVTEVVNHLPFAVDIRILAGQDTTTIAHEPLLAVGPLRVAAGEIHPTLHTCTGATVSRPELELSEAEARVFALPGLYTVLEVTLPGSDGRPVRLLGSDHLTVHGAARLAVLIQD